MAIIKATFYVDDNTLLKGTQLSDIKEAIGQELDCDWLHSAGIHLDNWELAKIKEIVKAPKKELPFDYYEISSQFADVISDNFYDNENFVDISKALFKLLLENKGNKEALDYINKTTIVFLGNGLNSIAEELENGKIENVKDDLNDVIDALENEDLDPEEQEKLNEQYFELDSEINALKEFVKFLRNEDRTTESLDSKVQNAELRVGKADLGDLSAQHKQNSEAIKKTMDFIMR